MQEQQVIPLCEAMDAMSGRHVSIGLWSFDSPHGTIVERGSAEIENRRP